MAPTAFPSASRRTTPNLDGSEPLPYIFRTKYYNAAIVLGREVDNARRYFEPELLG